MKIKPLAAVTAITLMCVNSASAEVIRGTGDRMQFDMGGIYANRGSTLTREWVIVNDENLPVRLTSFNARPAFDRNLVYNIQYDIEIDQEILAFEVRFIPFDIWGQSGRALSSTRIQDIEAGALNLSGQWRIVSESEAVQHFAMLGYIAKVKLASGEILQVDPTVVVNEARRFSEDFSSGDLASQD